MKAETVPRAEHEEVCGKYRHALATANEDAQNAEARLSRLERGTGAVAQNLRELWLPIGSDNLRKNLRALADRLEALAASPDTVRRIVHDPACSAQGECLPTCDDRTVPRCACSHCGAPK